VSWVIYAFDPAERPVQGRRKREWQAVAQTEIGVVREMARCLSEISGGASAEVRAVLAEAAETALCQSLP
jgi:hypothetical protein